MQVIKPSFAIQDCNNVMRNIERAARRCYKSEDRICEGSDKAIIEKILTPKHGVKHESVLEHGVVTVSIVMDRGVSHEQVRHRHTAISQESTRYCNYAKGKFGGEITVIEPFFFDPWGETRLVDIPAVGFARNNGKPVSPALYFNGDGGVEPAGTYYMNAFDVWMLTCLWAEWGYNTLVQQFGRSAQEARSVLPNSLKTELEITANVREWRHIFTLRTNRDAHPQIRQIMVPMAHAFAERWPVLFGEFLSAEHPCPAKQTP